MRHLLRRFLRLKGADQRLLIKVSILMGFIRVGLRLVSFQTLYRLLNGSSLSTPDRRPDPRINQQKIGWAVNAAGKYSLGDNSCLTQALTGLILLNRHGHDAKLRLGVMKDPAKGISAHAWVECDGDIVIGGTHADISKYTPLPELSRLTS